WRTNMFTTESLFGAVIRGNESSVENVASCHRAANSSQERGPQVANEALIKLLDQNADPGTFGGLPCVVQSAICDLVLALLRFATNDRDVNRGRQFVLRNGLPHQIELLDAIAPPSPAYRHWHDFLRFARNQRTWQGRIFHASQSLRRASVVASGTDELAR